MKASPRSWTRRSPSGSPEAEGGIAEHPCAGVFPRTEGEELAALAADIAANGLLEPIAMHGGMVLDGRARLRACTLAEVEPRFAEAELGSLRPLDYVLSRNLRRRHLTTVQLALLAFDLIPHYRESATERQRVGRAGLSEEQEDDRGYTNEKVAAVAGVSARTVRRVVAISRADPKVLDLMRKGVFGTVREASMAAGVEPGRNRPIVAMDDTDSWERIFPRMALYLRRWMGQPLDHLEPIEARRRFRDIMVIVAGLNEYARQLQERGEGDRRR